MKRESYKQILLLTVLTVLAAQVKITLLDSTLPISLGIILIPVFAIVLGEYSMIFVSALSGFLISVTRMATNFVDLGVFDPTSTWPEMMFYVCYGLLCSVYFTKYDWQIKNGWTLLLLALVDYGSNLLELVCRGESLALPNQFGVLIVAAARSIIIIGIWYALDRQSVYLLKKEHAKRYQQLMMLTSRLRGEVLWLQKNATMVEDTMRNAHDLYNKLEAEKSPLAAQALDISKDIHEIKKEYQLIMRGIAETMQDDQKESAVDFQELWQILKDDVNDAAKHSGLTVDWIVNNEAAFRTDKQYYLLSILRNLLDNALEAAENNKIKIQFSTRESKQSIVFDVKNWGKPIPADVVPHLFEVGFSTKINYTTGQVGRGIGLCLVRDIIEEKLDGVITYHEDAGATVFTVSIPKDKLEAK